MLIHNVREGIINTCENGVPNLLSIRRSPKNLHIGFNLIISQMVQIGINLVLIDYYS